MYRYTYTKKKNYNIVFCNREEQEKLNIWVAYLNLENMYGTPETLQTLFQKAVQHNDPLKVYQQLIVIYESSEKIEVKFIIDEILPDLSGITDVLRRKKKSGFF
jgi:hypothetical protein